MTVLLHVGGPFHGEIKDVTPGVRGVICYAVDDAGEVEVDPAFRQHLYRVEKFRVHHQGRVSDLPIAVAAQLSLEEAEPMALRLMAFLYVAEHGTSRGTGLHA